MPLPVPNTFHYGWPFEGQNIQVGQRVIVPFGTRKLYTGVVIAEHDTVPANLKVKPVDEVLDDSAVLTSAQLSLLDWTARYYLATPGEVLSAMLPGQYLVSSETVLNLLDGNWREAELSDEEFILLEALEIQPDLNLAAAAKITQIQRPLKVVRELMAKRLVAVREEMRSKYKPKVRQYVAIADHITPDQVEACMQELDKAPKQLEALMRLVQLSRYGSDHPVPVLQSELVAACGGARGAVKGLIDKDIIEVSEGIQSRLSKAHDLASELPQLSDHQQVALVQIQTHWQQQHTVLLRGVTASGKTEVYAHLIQEVLNSKSGQVLFLVPEIALTSQLVNRLTHYFGDDVGVYHSRLTPEQRVEVWRKMLNPQSAYRIVLGARSAVFLPFTDLKMVIVDEEHDTSYKQMDPSPRYHGRDLSIWLAKYFNAKVLLGSATPSIESLYHASQGKYGAVAMEKRFGDAQLPEILVADLQRERKRKTMNEFLSSFLVKHMEQTLADGQQVILFQNRRGFAPLLQCETCGYVVQCPSCDVSLTYHKGIHKLKCHYCGHHANLPTRCASCGDHKLSMRSFGTEKIEDHINVVFPKLSIKRMDLDTTRGKYAFQQLMEEFESGRVDILVGTQMVTKGLDFSNVGLVGIVDADHLMNYPDFRAHERAFQLMTQVAGRSGRKAKRGKVIIQTQRPDHNVIRYVMNGLWREAYKEEIIQRRNFGYPPFKRMIKVVLYHSAVDRLNKAVFALADVLRKQYGSQLLGPEFPTIPRLKNQYYKVFLLKLPPDASLMRIKKNLNNQVRDVLAVNGKGVRFYFDVDPY